MREFFHKHVSCYFSNTPLDQVLDTMLNVAVVLVLDIATSDFALPFHNENFMSDPDFVR